MGRKGGSAHGYLVIVKTSPLTWRSIERDNIKVSSQPVDNTAAESGGCRRCQQATLHFNQQHDLGPGDAGG